MRDQPKGFFKNVKKNGKKIFGEKNNSYNFVCLNVLVILIFAQSSLSHWWICKDETRCMAIVLILHLDIKYVYFFYNQSSRIIYMIYLVQIGDLHMIHLNFCCSEFFIFLFFQGLLRIKLLGSFSLQFSIYVPL